MAPRLFRKQSPAFEERSAKEEALKHREAMEPGWLASGTSGARSEG